MVKSLSFRALHVGFQPPEPKQARVFALAHAYGNGPGRRTCRERGRASFVHECFDGYPCGPALLAPKDKLYCEGVRMPFVASLPRFWHAALTNYGALLIVADFSSADLWRVSPRFPSLQ